MPEHTQEQVEQQTMATLQRMGQAELITWKPGEGDDAFEVALPTDPVAFHLLRTDAEAEDAAQRQYAAAAWREILHVAQRIQPDADVLDVRRAGQVWAPLKRAWIAAGEPGTFVAFADTALRTVHEEAA